MTNLFSNNYLNRRPIEKAMERFAKKFNPEMKVLDIGCGNKPYARYFKCEYVGLDPFEDTKADVIADAWDIPFPDNEFDGIILNQSLEHIEKTEKTISEIKRVLKPGGLCIITVPQIMKTHSIPVSSEKIKLNNFDKKEIPYWNNDFYRFTKFGLITLFQDFKILTVQQNTYYFGTIFQLINYFFAGFGIDWLFSPIYFINNCLGKLLDEMSLLISKIPLQFFKKFRIFILESLTIDNIFIIKK